MQTSPTPINPSLATIRLTTIIVHNWVLVLIPNQRPTVHFGLGSANLLRKHAPHIPTKLGPIAPTQSVTSPNLVLVLLKVCCKTADNLHIVEFEGSVEGVVLGENGGEEDG